MNNITLLAFLSPLILFFGQIKGFLLKIVGFLWKSRALAREFKLPFYNLIVKNGILLTFDNYTVGDANMYNLEKQRYEYVYFKLHTLHVFLYKNFIPIIISGKTDGIQISYFNFTFPFEKVLVEIIKFTINERKRVNAQDEAKRTENILGRFFIEEKHGTTLKITSSSQKESSSGQLTTSYGVFAQTTDPIFNRYDLQELKNRKVLNLDGTDFTKFAYSKPQESKQNAYQFTKSGSYIYEQVEKWIKAMDWYGQHNIPWRRGFALHGKPGTGKSSLIKAVARKIGIPLYIFNLSSMDNMELEKALSSLTWDAAIILIEDIDNVFDKRVNLHKTEMFGGLSFDYLLNKISGANAVINKLLFITTNDISKVDAALLRPGRIDEIIELESLSWEEQNRLANIMLPENYDTKLLMEKGKEMTTAEFENLCVMESLQEYWKK